MQATNWHCYYTNCLYLYVPAIYEGQTVTAARAEVTVLRRAERFGALTNVTGSWTAEVKLEAVKGGFAVYYVFSAQQHRLWEPVELGIRVTKWVQYGDGREQRMSEKNYYWDGQGGRVVRCGDDDYSDRVEEREAAAGRALEECVRRHRAETNHTEDVLFVARWGYVS